MSAQLMKLAWVSRELDAAIEVGALAGAGAGKGAVITNARAKPVCHA